MREDSGGSLRDQADLGSQECATDVWHRFTGPNANEPPRALIAAIIPGRGDVPGHLVLAQRPVEKTELRRHADMIAAAPAMRAALVQASNELKEHMDADDGRPNWAMRLKTEIDAALSNCPAPVSPSPPANEVSHHPSLASAASGMLAALEEVLPRYIELFEAAGLGKADASVVVPMMRKAISAARALGIKES